jgi:hypothetical protein
MALSNSVKTWVIDPTVMNNSRVEFRLNSGYLASNLKLIDVGVYSTNVVDRSTGVFYPSILGVLTAIKKISLFSGSTMIDEVQELGAYAAVQHLRVNNQTAEDLSRFELLNGFSFTSNARDQSDQEVVGTLTTEANHKDYVKTYLEQATNSFKAYHNNQIQVSATQDGGASGMIVLSNYLEFLRSVPVLPNIPDLRLILEWDLAAANLYVDPDAPSAVTPSLLPIRPQLVYEEILGVKEDMGLVKIPYTSMIVERFVVPAVANTVTNTTSFRSGAFRNRFLKDLVLFNKVTTDSSGGAGWLQAKERSVAQKNEKIQLVVNSLKLLPDQGINQEAMKLQYFNDSIGGLNTPLVCAMSSAVDFKANHYRLLDSHTGQIEHNFSVAGILINQVVDRLDVEYTRTGSTYDDDQTGAFNLLAFGRVNRLLEMKDGSIRLSY